MRALLAYYSELVELYAYGVEVSAALHAWTEELRRHASSSASGLENRVFFGRGDPNDPKAKYQYNKEFREIIAASDKGGRNERTHRNSVLVLAYSLWEVKYRREIALECGKRANDIQSDVFQDLNKYRQAVLKVGGQLDREPSKLQFFGKGDEVALTEEHMHLLFSTLVEALNEIGIKYYHRDPELSLDKSLNRP